MFFKKCLILSTALIPFILGISLPSYSQELTKNNVKKKVKSNRTNNIRANSYRRGELFQALEAGDEEAIKKLVKKKMTAKDIDREVNEMKNPVLISLAVKNKHQQVRLLLNAGADINITNKAKSTALMWAAYYGNLKTIKLLIAKGADLNKQNSVKDESQMTALMFAAKKGQVRAVEILLRAGANPDLVNSDNRNVRQYLLSEILRKAKDVLPANKLPSLSNLERSKIKREILFNEIANTMVRGNPLQFKTKMARELKRQIKIARYLETYLNTLSAVAPATSVKPVVSEEEICQGSVEKTQPSLLNTVSEVMKLRRADIAESESEDESDSEDEGDGDDLDSEKREMVESEVVVPAKSAPVMKKVTSKVKVEVVDTTDLMTQIREAKENLKLRKVETPQTVPQKSEVTVVQGISLEALKKAAGQFQLGPLSLSRQQSQSSEISESEWED